MINKVKNNKALIFDLDGTVADTMPLHYEASQIVCNKHGFDFPLEYFYSEAGRPSKDVFIDLMIKLETGLDGAVLAAKKEKILLELLPTVKLIQPVFEVMKHYHKKIPFAIGSGGERKAVISTLEALQITTYFDAIVSADDVLHHKPFPETFLKCANLLKVTPEHCVVFEDGNPGIIAAKKAEMDVIDVRNYI